MSSSYFIEISSNPLKAQLTPSQKAAKEEIEKIIRFKGRYKGIFFIGPPGSGKTLILRTLYIEYKNMGVSYLNLNQLILEKLNTEKITIDSQSKIHDWIIEIFAASNSRILILDNTEIIWALDPPLQNSLVFRLNRHSRGYIIFSLSTFPNRSVENLVELKIPNSTDWTSFFYSVPFVKINAPENSNFPQIIRRL